MRNNISPKALNILKAALPFVPPVMQRNLSYFIKVEEFNNMFNDLSASLDSTISACEINNNNGGAPFNPTDLIYAIRPYLDKNERDMINMFMNITTALNIYKSLGNNPSSLLGSMLSQMNNMNNFNNSNNSNNSNYSNNSNSSNNLNQTLNSILNSGLAGGINPNMINSLLQNQFNGNSDSHYNNSQNSSDNVVDNVANGNADVKYNETANNNTSDHYEDNHYTDNDDTNSNSQITEHTDTVPVNQADASIEALQRLITNNTGNQT